MDIVQDLLIVLMSICVMLSWQDSFVRKTLDLILPFLFPVQNVSGFANAQRPSLEEQVSKV